MTSTAPILEIRTPPIPYGTRLTLVPTQVSFRVIQGDAAGSPEGEAAAWETGVWSIDYSDTVRFLDVIEDSYVGEVPFPQFVSYQDVSLWHFLPAFLFPNFHRAVEVTKALLAVVDRVQPRGVIVHRPTDENAELWVGAARAVASVRAIPITFVSPNGSEVARSPLRRRLREAWWARSIRGAMDFLYDRAATYLVRGQRRSPVEDGARKLLFGTYPRLWTTMPGLSGNHDEQLSPLLDSLRSTGWSDVVGLEINYAGRRREALTVLRSRIRELDGVRWRFFSLRGARSVGRRARPSILEQWHALSVDRVFQATFCHEGVSLWPALEQTLKRAFEEILPDVVRMLHVADRLLEEERPDAVAMSYETGPYQRALIVQAARRGIPTVGLQHGTVFENSYEHMHRRVTTRPDLDMCAYPIPTVSCVWGPLFKQVYCYAGNYPLEAVSVTGHWRYDWLKKHIDTYDARFDHRPRGLDPHKRVVLICSSDQDSPVYLRHCIRALRKRDDVELLVKPHPSEPHTPIEHLLKDEGVDVDRLISSGPIEAMLLADVVVSQPSTLLSEAVLLHRPTAMVDLLHGNDSAPSGWERFASSGAFVYVTDPGKLGEAINALLDDEDQRSRLSQARSKFLMDFFAGCTGDAAVRVVQELENLYARRRIREDAADSRVSC